MAETVNAGHLIECLFQETIERIGGIDPVFESEEVVLYLAIEKAKIEAVQAYLNLHPDILNFDVVVEELPGLLEQLEAVKAKYND